MLAHTKLHNTAKQRQQKRKSAPKAKKQKNTTSHHIKRAHHKVVCSSTSPPLKTNQQFLLQSTSFFIMNNSQLHQNILTTNMADYYDVAPQSTWSRRYGLLQQTSILHIITGGSSKYSHVLAACHDVPLHSVCHPSWSIDFCRTWSTQRLGAGFEWPWEPHPSQSRAPCITWYDAEQHTRHQQHDQQQHQSLTCMYPPHQTTPLTPTLCIHTTDSIYNTPHYSPNTPTSPLWGIMWQILFCIFFTLKISK